MFRQPHNVLCSQRKLPGKNIIILHYIYVEEAFMKLIDFGINSLPLYYIILKTVNGNFANNNLHC